METLRAISKMKKDLKKDTVQFNVRITKEDREWLDKMRGRQVGQVSQATMLAKIFQAVRNLPEVMKLIKD